MVRRGESLGAIAKRYGLSTARLKSLNGIKGSRAITGQTLRVRSTVARPSLKSSNAGKGTTKATTKATTSKKSAAANKSTASKATNSTTSATAEEVRDGEEGHKREEVHCHEEVDDRQGFRAEEVSSQGLNGNAKSKRVTQVLRDPLWHFRNGAFSPACPGRDTPHHHELIPVGGIEAELEAFLTATGPRLYVSSASRRLPRSHESVPAGT